MQILTKKEVSSDPGKIHSKQVMMNKRMACHFTAIMPCRTISTHWVKVKQCQKYEDDQGNSFCEPNYIKNSLYSLHKINVNVEKRKTHPQAHR